jgi:hypothetical protein
MASTDCPMTQTQTRSTSDITERLAETANALLASNLFITHTRRTPLMSAYYLVANSNLTLTRANDRLDSHRKGPSSEPCRQYAHIVLLAGHP